MTESLFTSQGLVYELAEFMIRGRDGKIHKAFNPDWCESLACALVGTMIGKDRYLSNEFGKVRGNIFVIFIAASGLGFKTVPLSTTVRPTLKQLTMRTNESFTKEIGMSVGDVRARLEELKKATSRSKKYHEERVELQAVLDKLVDYEAPQKFTSEFLYTWLESFPQGMIAGDEYTKMFRGARTKEYLADNMEDLSRLYDCDPEKIGTQSRGVEYPDRSYVSFSSATTYYLFTIMEDDFFIQGTGNRILWILDDKREELDVDKEAMKGSFWWGIDEESEFYKHHNNLIEKLLKIDKLPKGLVRMDFDAGIMLDRYRVEKYNQAVRIFNKNRLNMDANLIARLAQNAMKLALIHCVGRHVLKDIDDINYMEVSQTDAQWAINKMERHFTYYMDMMRLAPELRKTYTKSYKNDQERVLFWIDEWEKKGNKITKTGLMNQIGWLKDDMQKILEALLAIGKIKMETGGVYKGKKVTHYVRNETENE